MDVDENNRREFIRERVLRVLRYQRETYQIFVGLSQADQDEILHGLLWLQQELGLSLGAGFHLLHKIGLWDRNGGDIFGELEARRLLRCARNDRG